MALLVLRACILALEHPDCENLALIVPLIERARRIEPFVTLKPDQPLVHGACERPRKLAFANARLSLDEKRAPKEPHHCESRGEGRAGDVANAFQTGLDVEWRFHRAAACLPKSKNRTGSPPSSPDRAGSRLCPSPRGEK